MPLGMKVAFGLSLGTSTSFNGPWALAPMLSEGSRRYGTSFGGDLFIKRGAAPVRFMEARCPGWRAVFFSCFVTLCRAMLLLLVSGTFLETVVIPGIPPSATDRDGSIDTGVPVLTNRERPHIFMEDVGFDWVRKVGERWKR